jgi:hypothetical protein
MKQIVSVILLAVVAATMVIMTARTTTMAPVDDPAIVLSSKIPGDAQFGALPPNATNEQKLLAIQGDFDIYSWNTFIALNWPPGPDGNGDPNKTIGQNGDNDTVWEHYRDVADIFLPGGARPTYNGPDSVPSQCKSSYKPGMRILSQVGKTPTVLTDFSQPFNTRPTHRSERQLHALRDSREQTDVRLHPAEHALLKGRAEGVFGRGKVSLRSPRRSRGRHHG